MRSSPSLPSRPPNRQRLGKRRQATVVLGATIVLLIIHPPTGLPSLAAGVSAIVFAGATLMAACTAVVSLWHLSSSTYHSGPVRS
jgi:hypothetical protein